MNGKRLTSIDEVVAAYREAHTAWRAKKLGDARRMVKEIRQSVADFPKLTLLEAFIARDSGEPLTELSLLSQCLAELERGQTNDLGLMAETWSMIGSARHILGETKEAVEAFSRAADIEPDLAQKRVEASNAIFAANGAADFTSEDFRTLYRRYEALLAPIRPFPKRRLRHDRLRIGYLSADLSAHPVGKLLVPLLERRNRTQFEAYCYAASEKGDAVTERLRAASDVWRNVASASDEETARLIYDDEIDVLAELGVHTKGNRLPVLAYRPATVQICGIGDVRSSGLSCVDYFLSDVWCAGDETSAREDFTERLIRLPHTHFCYMLPEGLPPLVPSPCLSRGFVTFGCFNNAAKITDETLSLWRRLLLRVPQSRLLLKHKLFSGEEGRRFMRERLARLGFDLSRVELRGFSKNHLPEYRDMDVALDTYPYTGGMTTFEALSMGVPVVSRYGARHGTRFGYSILQNLGLGELAAPSKEQYIEIAAALATDRELLSTLHEKLRSFLAASPLTNAAQYAADVEAAYLSAWNETVNKEAPLK